MTISFNQKFTNNNLELEVNVLPEECVKNSAWAKNARTGSDGNFYYVDYYNLDVVNYLGKRLSQITHILDEEINETLKKRFAI